MNRRLLGMTLVAVSAISMIGIASAALGWQGIDDDSVSAKNKNTTLLTIDATDVVPQKTKDLVGFAWLYVATSSNSAIAITQHQVNADTDPKNEVRDSTQNPDGWHPHNVNLGPGTTNSSACVTDIVDAPNAGVAIKGDLVQVNVRNSILTGDLSTASAVFDIIVDSDCPITNGTEVTEAGPLKLGIVIHDVHP